VYIPTVYHCFAIILVSGSLGMAALLDGEVNTRTTKLKRSAVPWLGCSRSLSHFPALPTNPSNLALDLSSTTSPHVTLRVLTLVKRVCRRFAKEVQKEKGKIRKGGKRIGRDVCRDLEREAYEEIDRYLGRKVGYPRSSNTINENRPGPKVNRYVHAVCGLCRMPLPY